MDELVREAVRLIEGRILPAGEAAALAKLVGSRTELFAHLLVSRRSFAAWPEISEALRIAAAEVGPGPTRDRPAEPAADTAGERGYRQLDTALRNLFREIATDPVMEAEAALRRFRGGRRSRQD